MWIFYVLIYNKCNFQQLTNKLFSSEFSNFFFLLHENNEKKANVLNGRKCTKKYKQTNKKQQKD